MEAVRGGRSPDPSAGPRFATRLERLRPLASESLLAVFALAMDDAMEHTFGRQLARMPRESRRR